MALINKKDIAPSDVLADFRKEVEVTTDAVKKLQEQVRALNKEATGENAKQRLVLADKLTKKTIKLKEVKRASVIVEEQMLKANAKLVQSQTKEAKSLAKLKVLQSEQNKKLREGARATLGMTKANRGLVGSLKNLGGQMFAGLGIIAGLRAMASVVTNSIKIFKDFTKESSRLAAILGKNKNEISGLTEQAKLLGSTTAFTASEVVALQIELAKLGFNLREIEDSTEGILALAAATGQDLASSAELAGATLRIFNLDASEMSRVTDVLALSTSRSSLSMEKLSTIMPIVGKTAQIAGVSLERTAALAGTLTDRGLDASMAGTALRNIFLELSKKGISWNDAMEQINNSTDKNKTAMDLFGKRAAAAGVVLSETAGSTARLTTELENANGAALTMADTMLNNLSGDITKASSAWEGFILSILKGEGDFAKAIRGIVQVATNLLGTLTRLAKGESPYLIGFKNANNYNEKLKELNKTAERSINIQEKQVITLSNSIAHIRQLLRIEKDDARRTQLLAQKKVLEEQLVLIKAKTFNEEKSVIVSKQQNSLKFKLAEILRSIEEQERLGTNQSKVKAEQLKFQRDLLTEQISHLEKLKPVLIENKDIVIETTESIKEQDNTVIKLTASQKKLNAELEKAFKARDTKVVEQIESQPMVDGVDISALEKQLAAENAYTAEIMAERLELAQEWEDAGLAIKTQAIESATQLANDIFSAGQDEKLAKINSAADAEKEILRVKLEDGLISEEKYASEIARIELYQRREAAKADKKKAIFDIAIRTAIAIVSALTSIPPNIPLSVAVGVIGATQAAAVAAKSLPKYAKGTELVKGDGTRTSDSIHSLLSKDERVVPANINDELRGVKNEDLPELVKGGMLLNNHMDGSNQNKNMLLASLLMNNNSLNEKILMTLMNGYSTVDRKGVRHVRHWSGANEQFNIE